ncbi:MAG: mechanosensitive ion channel family protein [Candidatus Diapherotrites archaeon]|nr:mechanosensitive ion channel family protein [Candidatus Diapherotrites archaeon]
MELTGLALYAVIIFLYIVLRPVYTRLLRRLISLTRTHIDDKLFSAVEKPIWFAILLFLVDQAVSYIYYHPIIHGIFLTLTVILITLALIRAGKIVIFELFGPTRFLNVDEKIKTTALTVLSNIYTALIIFFAFIYVLSVWGVDITPLIASAGLMGIVLGMALKDPLENLISGILLLMDPPFRVGDIVRVGDTVGEVKEIGLRNTRILTFDGDLVTMPNSSIIKTSVENFHMPSEKVRVRIRVGVSYDSDPEEVKELLLEIARSHPHVLEDPAPQALFLEMGDFALLFELRAWTTLPYKMQVLSDLNTAILKTFREKGIEIPYPIQTVLLEGSLRVNQS